MHFKAGGDIGRAADQPVGSFARVSDSHIGAGDIGPARSRARPGIGDPDGADGVVLGTGRACSQ